MASAPDAPNGGEDGSLKTTWRGYDAARCCARGELISAARGAARASHDHDRDLMARVLVQGGTGASQGAQAEGADKHNVQL